MNELLHVHHILVAHEYEAKDIERKLREGESFEELAKRLSSCPSASRGGDLGPVHANRFVEEFSEAALKLATGGVSGPVRTRFGYHLIKRIS